MGGRDESGGHRRDHHRGGAGILQDPGRFNTRLSLSSTGAGEVIRRRILSKNEHARDLLTVEYGKNATVLKNLFTFKGARNDLGGGYDGAESFADAFRSWGTSSSSCRTSSTACATRAARAST